MHQFPIHARHETSDPSYSSDPSDPYSEAPVPGSCSARDPYAATISRPSPGNVTGRAGCKCVSAYNIR